MGAIVPMIWMSSQFSTEQLVSVYNINWNDFKISDCFQEDA